MVWGKPQRGGDSYGPGCFMENGMEMYRRGKLMAHSRRSRKTEPRACCWLGSGDGVGRWRQGLVSVGSLEGQGQSGAASCVPFPLCQIWGACPQMSPANQGWGAHGAALEMGLVGVSASGSAVRMQHYRHRQEPSPAQGTYMAMLCTRSRKANGASTKG